MSQECTVGSLFTGIGGFDLGIERAGFAVRWQVEIDIYCGRVLDKHWPNVARYGDIRALSGRELEPVDLVCGGFPCQDLSVAGRRAGLAGERSRLFFEFMRIADALAPSWLLIENVPGLLSSRRGEDFAVMLECLTGFRPEVPRGGWRNSGLCWGPRRSVAWRVLDAQYFGVPQRRRRVFVVAGPGRTSAAAVLFEPESCDRHPTPGREPGQEVTQALTRGFGKGGPDDNAAQGGFLVPDVAMAVNTSANRMHGTVETFVIQDVRGGTRDRTDDGQGIGIRGGGPMYTLNATERHAVAHTLRAEGFDASEDGTGRGTPLIVQEAQTGVRCYESAGTLRSDTPGTQPCGSLVMAQCPDVAATLSSGSGATTNNPGRRREDDVNLILIAASVRRLTPLECERLQGFPDGWTGLDGKASDSARYRALGNAVAVPVAEWIGRRIGLVCRG